MDDGGKPVGRGEHPARDVAVHPEGALDLVAVEHELGRPDHRPVDEQGNPFAVEHGSPVGGRDDTQHGHSGDGLAQVDEGLAVEARAVVHEDRDRLVQVCQKVADGTPAAVLVGSRRPSVIAGPQPSQDRAREPRGVGVSRIGRDPERSILGAPHPFAKDDSLSGTGRSAEHRQRQSGVEQIDQPGPRDDIAGHPWGSDLEPLQ